MPLQRHTILVLLVTLPVTLAMPFLPSNSVKRGAGRAAGHVQRAAHPRIDPLLDTRRGLVPDTHQLRLVTLPIQRRLITDHTLGTR